MRKRVSHGPGKSALERRLAAPWGALCWIQELLSPDTTRESLQGYKPESDLTGLRFRTGGRPGRGGAGADPQTGGTCRGHAEVPPSQDMYQEAVEKSTD